MNKKKYKKPEAVNVFEHVNSGVPGALWGAALMVGRALAKAMKGGIDLTAGVDVPNTLQERKKQ